MLFYRLSLLVFGLFLTVYYSKAAFSEKQLASAKKMITNICKPKANATDDDLQAMKVGEFSRPAMCFINCVLVSNKWQNKDNTFNEAGALNSMKMLPPEFLDEGKRVIDICKDAAKTLDDKCVSAFEIGTCFYLNSDDLKKFLA